jgi:tRNA (mo5U34)-methyltransferase
MAIDREATQRRIQALAPWFHSMDLGNGIYVHRDKVHGGEASYPSPLWKRIRPFLLPDLERKRVLDVGCNAGTFCVEAVRMGASYVLGIDVIPQYLEQAKLVREILRLDFDLRELNAYDVDEKDVGTFDVTLLLGVVHHFRHPLLGLEKAARVTRDLLVLESAVVPPSRAGGQVSYGGPAHEIRFIENGPGIEGLLNWFVPSLDCLKAFLDAVGFKKIVGESVDADRALLVARRS